MKTDLKNNLIPYLVAFLVAAIALVPGTILLINYGPGNMGRGFAAGGTVALVGLFIIVWRAVHKPHDSTSLERVFTQGADERDTRIVTQSAAAVGLTAIPAVSVAGVAVGLGASGIMVVTIVLFLLIAVATTSFVLALRRN